MRNDLRNAIDGKLLKLLTSDVVSHKLFQVREDTQGEDGSSCIDKWDAYIKERRARIDKYRS